MTTKVRGMDQLQRRLAALKLVVTPEQLEAALVAGGLLIANRAKALAPYQTGTLRRSLHVGGYSGMSSDFKPGEGYGDIGKPGNGGTSATVLIGTNLEYARYVEFGTSKRRAKPYLRPAFDATREAAVKEVQAALKELIQGAASE